MVRKIFFIILIFVVAVSCSDDIEQEEDNQQMYFPPVGSDEWETTTTEDLDWDETVLEELYNYLENSNSRAFLVLKDGRLVVEKYWGKNILNISAFDKNSIWYWASAGKSLTAFLVGIAQENGLLDINEKTSTYLGEGWTSLPLEKENLVTVRHNLTMTTGFDYQVDNLDCTDPECFQYKTDAGEQWFYHNGAHAMLEDVVSSASGLDYNTFTDTYLETKTGMNGTWIITDNKNIYWSSARDAARFGLLILNQGIWDGEPVLSDENYINAMLNTSQDLNLSYGYLWWLNGKSSIIFPGVTFSVNRSLCPNAPEDMVVAAGKNGQIIDVIPSENMVVVRMGEAPDNSLLPVTFHDEMWEILGKLIQ